MKIGEKIKRVRLHRHMKQRELGELVGFTDGAANRIAQYESGFRVPKEDMVKKIAAALNVAECALLEPDTAIWKVLWKHCFGWMRICRMFSDAH